MRRFQVKALDHLALRVEQVERSLEFYTGILGLERVYEDEFRSGKMAFPSVRLTDDTILDLFPPDGENAAGQNLSHFCIVVDEDLLEVRAYLESKGVEIVRGPVHQIYGARGLGSSIYFLDPDRNQIEMRVY